jgi:hypothetical protein
LHGGDNTTIVILAGYELNSLPLWAAVNGSASK